MSVLRWQSSHLLLIRPNLGYGSVLMWLAPVRAVVPLIIITTLLLFWFIGTYILNSAHCLHLIIM
jgi:hypothetical protein